MELHPSTKIALWIVLAALLPALTLVEVGGVVGVLSVAAVALDPQRFLTVLRRARWLLLGIVIIYTLGALADSGWQWRPEVMAQAEAAIVQAMRLVAMLAAMTWLLATTSTENLLGGIYFLLGPFMLAGVDRDRWVSRLWLTLEYVERLGDTVRKRDLLSMLDQQHDGASGTVTLRVPAFHARDIFAMGVAGVVLWSAWA